MTLAGDPPLPPVDLLRGTGTNRLAALAEAAGRGRGTQLDRDAIRRAAVAFEAVFIGQMLSHLWRGIPTDGPFGGGPAEETYRSLLIEEYGKQIARAGGFGIAADVERQLLALQEV